MILAWPCAESKQAAVLKQPAGHASCAGDCIRLIRLGTAAMCAERLQRVSHPVNMYTQANSVYGQQVRESPLYVLVYPFQKTSAADWPDCRTSHPMHPQPDYHVQRRKHKSVFGLLRIEETRSDSIVIPLD